MTKRQEREVIIPSLESQSLTLCKVVPRYTESDTNCDTYLEHFRDLDLEVRLVQ